MRVNRPVFFALILALALANAYVYAAVFASPIVRVEQLAVGKGNATLILMPDGHAVLINAGPDAGILRALGGALPPWQRQLDTLIVLEPSAGQQGGAPFVLGRYKVGTLLRSSAQGTPAREATLAAAASVAGTKITKIPPEAGLILHYGSFSLTLSASTTPGTYALENKVRP